MHKKLLKYILPAVLALLLVTCGKKQDAGEKSGKIKFRISYDQDKVGGYSTTVLPKEMIMVFGHNKVRNSIEGGLGFFSLVHVSDLREDQHTTWLKFIDKRYIFEGERDEPPCCFGMLAGMKLEFTDSTKLIAGLNCQKVMATFPENGMDEFAVWFTEDLDLVNPNSNTPFEDIPGVLLEFDTFMGNAHMHMVATSFEVESIPLREFQAPKNYRAVSKSEMETILNALMN